MKIFITGGLGFVGSHLSRALLEDGHVVTAVGRRRRPANMVHHSRFRYLAADTTRGGSWQDQLPGHDVVINLAGRSIFNFWTRRAKKQIYDSRIFTTRNIVAALSGNGRTLLISTSAVGYYGDRGEEILKESASPGDDFLSMVGLDWEREALKADSGNTRVVLTRFGIVLARGGGAMAKMIPIYKMGLGGRLSTGRQWFAWIHLKDLIDVYRFVIDHPEISGPVNCCAPHPVRNKDLAETLAGQLNRPTMFPIPAFAVKAVLGEFGASLLCSQRAKSDVLETSGFEFTYPEISAALTEIIHHEPR